MGGGVPHGSRGEGASQASSARLGPCSVRLSSPLSLPPPTPTTQGKKLPVQQQWQIPVLQAFLNHHRDQPGGRGREIGLSCSPKTGARRLTSWPLALQGVPPGMEARCPGPQPPSGGAWRDREEEGGSDFQNWHRDRAGLAGGRRKTEFS